MVEMKVDASEIKGEGNDMTKQFADFLKEKTSADVTSEGNTITVKGEGPAVAKKYLRILTKKFLHKQKLDETYKVISEVDNTLKVKERKLAEED
jgi:hypothetical protein